MTELHEDRELRQYSMPRIWSGIVVTAPATAADLLSVSIPDMHPDLVFHEVRWSGSGALPSVGDQCLVIFDNERSPWVLSTWPYRSAGISPAPPTGPAGGDLYGTYPNPNVGGAAGDFFGHGRVWAKSGLGAKEILIGDVYGDAGISGIRVGGDTYLYRNSAATWKMASTGLQVDNQFYAHWNGSVWNISTLGTPPGLQFGGDVNLYRNAAGSLLLGGVFNSTGYIAAYSGAAVQVVLADVSLFVGGASRPGVMLGSGNDTWIARTAASTLRINQLLEVNQGAKIGVSSNAYLALVQDTAVIYMGASNDVNLYRRSAQNLQTDDTFWCLQMVTTDTLGRVYLGNALDTDLYRGAAGVVVANNALTASAGGAGQGGNLGGGNTYNSANNWMIGYVSGGLYWDGSNWQNLTYGGNNGWGLIGFRGADGGIDLYMTPSSGAANRTYTSAQLMALNKIRFDYNGNLLLYTGQIQFASDSAANLYRSAAGIVKTDGNFYVANNIKLNTDGTATFVGRLFSGNGAGTGGMWVDYPTNSQFIGSYDSNNIGVVTSGAWRFLFSNNNTMYIGTPFDTYIQRVAAGVLGASSLYVPSTGYIQVASGNPGGYMELGQVGSVPGAPSVAGARIYDTFESGQNALYVVFSSGARVRLAIG